MEPDLPLIQMAEEEEKEEDDDSLIQHFPDLDQTPFKSSLGYSSFWPFELPPSLTSRIAFVNLIRKHRTRPPSNSTRSSLLNLILDRNVYSIPSNPALLLVMVIELLHSVKFLKLNLETVEILSSSVDVILHQPSPFVNLKSLKIYPNREYMYNQEPKKVAMSTELKSYLLDSSPRATFTMVLREEIQAQKLIAELQVLLKKEIDNIKSSEANLEREKTPVESHEPKKLEIGGSIAQIKSSLENLVKQIQQRKENACIIISKLQHVVELVTSLPASNRAKIQPCLSSLCAEADTVISKINDSMKFQCDENQSRSRVCFDEIATKLEPGHFLADCSKFFDDAKSSSQHPNLR
ncbi:hypothetical protein QVD17_04107 [Tagetes erecta]|uniref:Uncharacterized protein n=1 Tax=Tagetes erecta TaxID=13708 RepID=A0AAD8P417_TARER|nr:hypothetical protein QVD17_04107 [Tagetes erecta]